MRRFEKITKSVLSLTLVACLALGTVPANVSAGVSDRGYDSGISVNDPKYNDTETSGAESSVAKMNFADSAAQSAADAEAAADAATAAVEAAQEALTEAQGAYADEQTAADTVTEKAAEAGTAEGNADKAAADAEAAADAAAEVAEEAQADEETFAADVKGYNDQVAKDQDAIDTAASDVKKNVEASASAIAESKKTADELQSKALEAAQKALDADGQDRIDAAAEVTELASQAATVLKNAEKNLKNAKNARTEAIDAYNKYAMSYGLPLYGETEVTYNAEDSAQVNAAAAIDSEYKALQSVSLDSYGEAIEAADGACAAAADAYNTAKSAAETALETVKSCAGTVDTETAVAIEAADAAISSANAATEYAEAAIEAADKTINYYVNIAEASLKETEAQISENNKKLDAAKADRDAKKAVLEAAVPGYTADATTAYNNELAARKSAYEAAKREYDNLPKWRFIEKAIAKDKMDDAKDAYDNYNKNSVKQSLIDAAIANSTEKKSLDAANASVAAFEAKGTELNAEKSQKDATLSQAKSAVETAKSTYLADVDSATEAAREQIMLAFKAELGRYSDEINQAEFDKALAAWANDTFNTWHIIQKGQARNELDDVYSVSFWNGVFNTLGITQWTVGTGELQSRIDAVIAGYREALRQAEEKKSETIAAFAKVDAENVLDSLEDIDANAVQTAAGNVQTLADALRDDAQGTVDKLNGLSAEYEGRIDAAEQKLNQAKEDLADVKKAAGNIYELDEITLQNLLNAILAADKSIEVAEKTVAKVKTEKATIDRYAELANNYAEYAKEDGELQKATGYAQKTAEGLVYGENFYKYDLEDKDVVSRGTGYFDMVSGKKQLEVPEKMYQAFAKAIINKTIKDTTGSGIALTETYFWFIGEDGKLTGEYETDSAKLATGKYFLGYVFKQEGDAATVGYHIDGYLVEYTAPEKQPEVPVEDPEKQPEGPANDPEKQPEYQPEKLPVDIEDLPTVIDPELLDEEVIEIETPEVPEGSVEEETPEVVEVPELEVPEGQPEETQNEEVPEELTEVVELPEIETPAGEAEDVLPQTGTAPIAVFYGLGAACILLGGSFVLFGKRKFN